MASIKLVASTYSVSNNTVTVSSASNMYTDVSSNTYATITHTTSGTSSYHCYIKGFNFDDVPSNAVVNSFTISIRGYESNLSTSATYAPRLCNDTTTISGTTASSNFGTSASTITVPYTGTWDSLKAYGEDLGIRVTVRRSNRNTQGYLYIYGAEISVDYTIPVYHNVTVSGDGTHVPSGTTSVLEGTSYTQKIYGLNSKPTVTDNNVDVTSQVTESTTDSIVQVPDGNTNSGFTVTNIGNAYNDATNTTYASLELNGGSSGTIYLNTNVSLPSGATVQSVSCSFTYQYNRNSSSSGYTASCRMYSNTTAKGSSSSLVSAGGTDVAKTTISLSVGSWSASELSNARLQITATNSASSTHRFLYIYGVSFTVTYTASGKIYTYTISNVQADHVIVVTASASTQTIYFKDNGSWVAATAVYKKVNGSWILQSDLSSVFDANTNYVRG